MKVHWMILAGFALATLLAGMAKAASDTTHLSQLRCEYLVDPLGIGETSPRLRWMLESPQRGERQIAYQVLVASTREQLAKDQGDLWDSGRVDSDQSAQVVYRGKPLTSRLTCFWKVQIRTALGGEKPLAWSSDALWTMGLLDPADWQAQWIDTHEAQSAAQQRPIKILQARYTTPSNRPSVDVTSRVEQLIQTSGLNAKITNDAMGGDPAFHTRKQLNLKFEQDGSVFEATIPENATIAEGLGGIRYLRKSFTAQKPIAKAVLYVTALGLYEVHINGQRVGDHILAPDWTDFRKRVRYQAYDVTEMLKPGGNAIGALLANGWYAGHLGNGGFQEYGKTPALLAQLEIAYTDGSTDRVASDESWKTADSPLRSTDFMLGETYDARMEIAGWDRADLDESGWLPASARKEERTLDWQVSPPVRETGLIKPVALAEPAPGRWTFDLGQNMVGVVRLQISEPSGTQITLHHAEMLNPDGTVYTTNLRGAPSVDVYTCKGGGTEIWQPHFTFHGFRYVELTDLHGKPGMDAVTGVVLGSDTPRTGAFSCSDPRINQLMSNIQWGQRGNYLSVPTDCPQRDERLGWMGDAEVFVKTATYNADVAAFFSKWLVDVDDAQTSDGAYTDVSPARGTGAGTPAWGDAGVICPWTIYQAYGDKRILEKHLPAMTKWVEWCHAHSTDLIRDKDRGGDYGDWLSINADTPKELIGTAYFAYSTHLVAQACKAVGDNDGAAKYQQLFEDIKTAFNTRFVDGDGRIKGNTQCCYAMALKFDLLPEALRPVAARYLADDIKSKNWHLSTGFVGVSYLLPTLSQAGDVDVAYRLLMQDSFPSWLFSVKHGATTIWERWDGWTPDRGFQDPGMNSFNHYSLGSCGQWLYAGVAGLAQDPAGAGFARLTIRPLPGGGLTEAHATLDSIRGRVASAWKIDGGRITLNVTVPPNATAAVYVPTSEPSSVRESGHALTGAPGIAGFRDRPGAVVVEIGSGTYQFAAAAPRSADQGN
jgi:alpha-L-rhamnosidase